MQGGKSISVRPFQNEPPRRDGAGGPGAGPRPYGAAAGGPPGAGPRPGGFGGGAGGGAAGAPDRTLYVGNLPYDCTQVELETLINGVAAGQVARVHLPMDPDGRKRGFGFVTMASSESAKAASEALKTADLRGRRLIINLAHPKGERPAGGGGGYAGGGGGGYGGGGGGYGAPPPAAFGGGGGGGPVRKTFDDRRRRHTNNNEDGPKKRRFEREDRGGSTKDDDWTAGGTGGTGGDDD
jgi:hypothetical protein